MPSPRPKQAAACWLVELGNGDKHLDYSLGGTAYLFGDAEIDQTAQGVRAAGEFDTNYLLFLGGAVRYIFYK
jgi:hypothetical protein